MLLARRRISAFSAFSAVNVVVRKVAFAELPAKSLTHPAPEPAIFVRIHLRRRFAFDFRQLLQQCRLLGSQLDGNPYDDTHDQITAGGALQMRQAFAAQTQQLAGLNARGNLDARDATNRWNLDIAAQRG